MPTFAKYPKCKIKKKHLVFISKEVSGPSSYCYEAMMIIMNWLSFHSIFACVKISVAIYLVINSIPLRNNRLIEGAVFLYIYDYFFGGFKFILWFFRLA